MNALHRRAPASRLSALRQLLGTEHVLIQAPMAGVQGSALALAAADGGALGSLPAAMLAPSALRAELEALRAVRGREYAVNFFCHRPPPQPSPREAAWRALLRPYFDELALDAQAIPAAPARQPFDAGHAALVEEFRPRVVSFHFGLPEAALLARVRASGAVVMSSATTVDEARWLEAHGADVVIAQGLEAGGHRGMFLTDDLTTQCGTLALLPQVVQAVQVPVVAAGGVADAAGVAAAMALGAAGVQVGTAYLCCTEATTSALHRRALQGPGAAHTALTTLFSGRPARGIVNRLMRELGPLHPDVPEFPLAGGAIAPLRVAAEALGSTDFSPLWSGQNARGCRACGAADLSRSLAQGLPRGG